MPASPSKAPDYFCTWNIQGYLSSYISTPAQREAMKESNMFGDSLYQNWLNFYPSIRQDLIFVMDDSWDIPLQQNNTPNPYLGLVQLDETRFPSYTGTPEQRLQKLTNAVKAKGWRSLGGWICAQEATTIGSVNAMDYWKQRVIEANNAGFSYWKVDWGKQDNNGEWRDMLTKLGHTYAPGLTIEHAMNGSFLSFADAFRT